MNRKEYADFLRAEYATTIRFGGNPAILAHARKVEAMTDAEYLAHRARLAERSQARGREARRLTRSVR